MYRQTKVMVAGGYDSTLVYPVFGPLNLYFDQTKDLQHYSALHRVNATDTEYTVPLTTTLTAVNFTLVASDYPILVRVVTSGTAQLTLKSNNVPTTNVGSPLPDQCIFMLTGTLPSAYLTLAPITGAVQTANVKVFCTGDPQSTYV